MSDHSVPVEVHLLGDLASILIGDVAAAALHHVADLVLRNHTVSVDVNDTESFTRVEVGVPLQALACSLCGAFCAHHGSKERLESVGGGEAKDVVFSVDINSSVCRRSPSEHVSIVGVSWSESFCEFVLIKTTISVSVVPLEEEVDVFLGHVDADVLESVPHIHGRY